MKDAAKPLQYTFAVPRACNMCGAGADHFGVLGIRLNRSQGFNPAGLTGIAVGVRQCRACGLIFADPQPTPQDLQDHYGDAEEYWSEDYYADDASYFGTEVAEAKALVRTPETPKALDIGAGIGKAMQALNRAGFDAFGIEPSRVFRDIALKRGIAPERLILAAIEEAAFEDEAFDYITFGAVLEHLSSPADALERAFQWLKPGGIIQVEVPSSRYLMSKLSNGYFRLRGTNYVTNLSPMHPPYHLFEFDLRSFALHGRRAGYEVASYRYGVGGIMHLPKLIHPALRWYMERTNTGMQLTVHLRKLPQGHGT